MKCSETLLWKIIELALRQLDKKTFHLEFGIGPVSQKQRTQIPMELSITNEQKIKITLNPVTHGGHPVELDGVPTWEVVSGDSEVEMAVDGKSAFLISADGPGETVYKISADADLGSGVVTIEEMITLTVANANAEQLGATAGTAEPK